MFSWGKVAAVQPERRLQDYPSFRAASGGGHARGPMLVVAGALLAASIGTGASLLFAGGATAGSLSGRDAAPPPVVLQGGCDGVWGNEPLDCLLQAA